MVRDAVALCGSAIGDQTGPYEAREIHDERLNRSRKPWRAVWVLFVDGICLWDLDANGSVGVSDLLSLLASWGLCKDCPADFDDNGAVGVSDLLALLANWGPCP